MRGLSGRRFVCGGKIRIFPLEAVFKRGSRGRRLRNDFKRILLEYCQSVHTEPEYTEEEKSGPPHNPRYVYAVSVNGELLGRGEGASKIQAQADAAEQALKKLGIDYNLFNRGSK